MTEEITQEPTLEDIENLFTELFNQMSSVSTKLTQLGKRIREETAGTAGARSSQPNIDALEREYQTLPVSTRPSWFEYAASHCDVAYKQSHNARFEFVASHCERQPEAKKFAPSTSST